MNIRFKRERVSEIAGDILPLIPQHYEEIAPSKEFEFHFNVAYYEKIEALEMLRIFSARSVEGRLLGYHFFIVCEHPHYQRFKSANQLLLYIDPKERGFGWSFLRYCDEELQSEGVHVIHQTVTKRYDFSPLLKRMGYHLDEQIYLRRV